MTRATLLTRLNALCLKYGLTGIPPPRKPTSAARSRTRTLRRLVERDLTILAVHEKFNAIMDRDIDFSLKLAAVRRLAARLDVNYNSRKMLTHSVKLPRRPRAWSCSRWLSDSDNSHS